MCLATIAIGQYERATEMNHGAAPLALGIPIDSVPTGRRKTTPPVALDAAAFHCEFGRAWRKAKLRPRQAICSLT